MLKQITLASCLTLLLTAPVHAAEFMDAAWAKQACAAWNADSNLTSGLMDADGYSWIKTTINAATSWCRCIAPLAAKAPKYSSTSP